MANVNRPRGGRVVRHLDGSPFNGATNRYPVAVTNVTAIFPGDFIIQVDDGTVAPYTGVGGGNLLGTCVSVPADPNALERRYMPALTAGDIYVADASDLIFEIQEDDAGTALDAGDVGNNVDVSAGVGSTSTGQSAHELLRASVVPTVAQLRLLRLVEREDNDYGDYAAWEVLINEHVFKDTAGT